MYPPHEYEPLCLDYQISLDELNTAEHRMLKTLENQVISKAAELTAVQKGHTEQSQSEYLKELRYAAISTILDAHEGIFDYLEQVETDILAYMENTNKETIQVTEDLMQSTEDVYKEKNVDILNHQREIEAQKEDLKQLKESTLQLQTRINNSSRSLSNLLNYAKSKRFIGYDSIEALVMTQLNSFPTRFLEKISESSLFSEQFSNERRLVINSIKEYCQIEGSEVDNAIHDIKNKLDELFKEFETEKKALNQSEEALQQARWTRISLEQQLLDSRIHCSENILCELTKSRIENQELKEKTINAQNLHGILFGDLDMLCEKYDPQALSKFVYLRNCQLLDEMVKEMSSPDSNSLRQFNDPDIFFEDGTFPIVVNSGSFDALCFVLLHEGNHDPMYFKSLSVLISLSQKTPQEVFLSLSENLFISDYSNKNDRVLCFATQLSKWFSDWYQSDETMAAIDKYMPDNLKKSLMIRYQEPFNLKVRYVKFASDMNFMTCDVRMYVNHLSTLQTKLINSIKVSELISSGWTKPSRDELAPNVVKMTKHFNGLTNMALSTIKKCDSDESKLEAIKRWITICEESRKQNNYLTVFALIGALSNPSLSKLIERLDSETRRLYGLSESLTSPLGKFRNYTRELSKADVKKTIPFIGTFLTNLVFIDDGNPLVRKNPRSGIDVLSLNKCRLVSEQVDGILQGWGSDLRFYVDKRLLVNMEKEIDEAADMFSKCSK